MDLLRRDLVKMAQMPPFCERLRRGKKIKMFIFYINGEQTIEITFFSDEN